MEAEFGSRLSVSHVHRIFGIKVSLAHPSVFQKLHKLIGELYYALLDTPGLFCCVWDAIVPSVRRCNLHSSS